MNAENILIKIEHRGVDNSIYRSGRDAFWGEIILTAKAGGTKKPSPEVTRDDGDMLEARLEHGFGTALRNYLIKEMVERPLMIISDDENRTDKTGEVLQHLGYRRSPPEIDPASVIELAQNEIEYLRQMNVQQPYRTELYQRAVCTSAVFFSARVAGYDSLLLELTAAPASSVADAFKGDIAAFQAFLDSALPQVFVECLPSKMRSGASRLRYEITIAEGFSLRFLADRTDPEIHRKNKRN
jgi:hypothetical protein